MKLLYPLGVGDCGMSLGDLFWENSRPHKQVATVGLPVFGMDPEMSVPVLMISAVSIYQGFLFT